MRGPEQPDIVVVDLPWIFRARSMRVMARKLRGTSSAASATSDQGRAESHTPILLVSEAKQDAELTGAVDLI